MALVSVLLIVAILMAITSRLLAGHNLVINQHQNTFEMDQALEYVLGAEVLARQVLYEDWWAIKEGDGEQADHLGDLWAQPVLPFELDEGGFIEARIVDMQGCFDLNDVVDGAAVDEDHYQRFRTLLRNLGLDQRIADEWVDWIDGDDEAYNFGADGSDYLLSAPAHRTPNQPISHLSELRLLRSVEREQLAVLLPHVCLRPTRASSLVNVNTASAEVLKAMATGSAPGQNPAQNDDAPGLDEGAVESFVSSERAYTNVQTFLTENPSLDQPLQGKVGVVSEVFRLEAEAQLGSTSVSLVSVLYRDSNLGNVTVISRDFGKLFRSSVQVDVEEGT